MDIIIENELVTLRVEYNNEMYFLHCDIHEWSKDTYKQLIEDWAELVSEIRLRVGESELELHALIPVEEDKILRFASMFGFNLESMAKKEGKMYFFMSYKVN